jgi:hypothetical protein
MKIVNRTSLDGMGMDEIILSCGHALIARREPNARLLKAGLQDDSYVSPDSTVAKCPICELN